MKAIAEFTDERNRGSCIHCGHPLQSSQTTRDHIPTKSLLRQPYPENIPAIDICQACNNAFSGDEEYLLVFLEVVLAGSTEGAFPHNPNVARALARNSKLKSAIDLSRSYRRDDEQNEQTIWLPDMDCVSRVVLKNARGHAYYELGEPIFDSPTQLLAAPLSYLTGREREEFENSSQKTVGWPEVGSRLMTRVITGKDLDAGWIVVQDAVYRYNVSQIGSGVRVQSVIFNYLATEVIWE